MIACKTKYSLMSVLIGAAVIAGNAQTACSQVSGTKDSVNNKTVLSDTVLLNEPFDVRLFNDDIWIIEPAVRMLPASDTVIRTGLKSGGINENDLKTITVPGFRVQVFSTTDYYAAVRTRNEALTKFTEEILMDYEQPYYKIRVGNFTDKQKADDLRNFARTIGYTEAWVIQTKVTINK